MRADRTHAPVNGIFTTLRRIPAQTGHSHGTCVSATDPDALKGRFLLALTSSHMFPV